MLAFDGLKCRVGLFESFAFMIILQQTDRESFFSPIDCHRSRKSIKTSPPNPLLLHADDECSCLLWDFNWKPSCDCLKWLSHLQKFSILSRDCSQWKGAEAEDAQKEKIRKASFLCIIKTFSLFFFFFFLAVVEEKNLRNLSLRLSLFLNSAQFASPLLLVSSSSFH